MWRLLSEGVNKETNEDVFGQYPVAEDRWTGKQINFLVTERFINGLRDKGVCISTRAINNIE